MKPSPPLYLERLDLISLFRCYRGSIALTWGMVMVENLLLALIPLLIGFTIDSLIAGSAKDLVTLGGIMLVLTLVAVGRRIYDTRTYGTIRVYLGMVLSHKQRDQSISIRNARLDMSRELVDFLEQQIPELLTGITQILVSLIVLASFGWPLALSSTLLILFMLLLYSRFHRNFVRFNGALNAQAERQVALLASMRPISLQRHLLLLRGWEVKLSDTEALLYGGIFLGVTGFILANLWLATANAGVSAGQVFTIVSYSWGYMEAALVMPVTLQSLSRLREITDRINHDE